MKKPISLPEIEVGSDGSPRPPMSPSSFVQSQGVGIPNGETADDGARSLLRSEYDFAPWAGTQSALGLMPSGEKDGGFEPSLYQNLKDGNLGDAFLQAVSVVPEVGPAAAKGAVGLGALYKALKSTPQDIRVAMDPSLARGFMVADPADPKTQRAMNMAQEGRSSDEIWNESNRIVSPTKRQAVEEYPDKNLRFTSDAENWFDDGFPLQGEMSKVIVHDELRSRLPQIFDGKVVLKEGEGAGWYAPHTGNIGIETPQLYNGDWWSSGDAVAAHELTHAALKETNAYDLGANTDALMKRQDLMDMAELAAAVKAYQAGDMTALTPSSARAELMQRHVAPGKTFSDFIRNPAEVDPEHLDTLRKIYGTEDFGPLPQTANDMFFSGYYSNFQEYLARLAMMRLGMDADMLKSVTPNATMQSSKVRPGHPHPTEDMLFEFPKALQRGWR